MRQRLNDALKTEEADDANSKDLVRKCTNLEDTLACEETKNRDLEKRLEEVRAAATAVQSELTATQTATDGMYTDVTAPTGNTYSQVSYTVIHTSLGECVREEGRCGRLRRGKERMEGWREGKCER